jgi:aldehyde:ferredoxin oxidoreductase
MPTGFEPDEQGWRNTWELNVEVNRLGMSVWESMELFRFLVSLRDAGLITEEESGLPLYGDQRELWLALLHQIAYREGIGDVLTEQLPRAAEQIGCGSADLFVQTKGWAINLPWDDPRVHPMHAMLSSTGTYLAHAEPWFLWAAYAGELHLPRKDSRHLLSSDEIAGISRRVFGSEVTIDPPTFEGKAGLAVHSQNFRMLGDALPFCRFAMHYDLDYYKEDLEGDSSLLARLYSAVAGEDVDQEHLNLLGERLFNLDRAQGIKQGYRSREDDLNALDKRVFKEPHEFSPLPGKIVDRDAWLVELDRYYRLRGWDPETGVPTVGKLEQLGLQDESEALRAWRDG